MEPEKSKRHVRALERYSRSEGHAAGSAAWENALAGIAAYEEELMADLDAEGVNVETMVGRALYELTAGGFRHSDVKADELRDALKAAFSEEVRY